MARKIAPLLEVNQWVSTWDVAAWGKNRPKPPAKFYVAAMSLKTLRRLSGVQPRTTEDRRAESKVAGYQRAHDEDRLSKIGRYIEYGFPLSTERGLAPTEHRELINPGWLPTSILINIIGANEPRFRKGKSRTVEPKDLVKIVSNGGLKSLEYPEAEDIGTDKLHPLEIVDGQHRLLAADQLELPDDYQVPVVFFDNLPLPWQAYLFWVINVEPKRINTSLAFDLYPELRDQDWLKRGEAVKIYKEHRSQELVEVLWRNSASPWKDRIELFGKRVDGHVSNAAAIRSLMATFVRTWAKSDDPEDTEEFSRLGGLFGSIAGDGARYVIRWNRPEQAAFLIFCWTAVRDAVESTRADWKEKLGSGMNTSGPELARQAFAGHYTLLATDQGFRAISFGFNALSQIVFDKVGLTEIEGVDEESEPTEESVLKSLKQFEANKVVSHFVRSVANAIIGGVDWRTSAAPKISSDDKMKQAQYRGSSGYKELNKATLKAANNSSDATVRGAAEKALDMLGWADA